MAKYRPKVPRNTKRDLISEAGGKCANPGCPNKLIEIHHIKEWHIYKTHDETHMIAICPSCHDSITRGNLRIDDQTLYRWKNIRHKSDSASHIYLEPGEGVPKVVLGTISVESATNFVVFQLSEYNDLEFCVREGVILLPRLRIGTIDRPLINVIDGHVLSKSDDIEFNSRPGKIQVNEVHLQDRIPAWAWEIISADPELDISNQPLLDIEAIGLGILRVKGVWIDGTSIVIVNDRQLSFIYPGLRRPLTLIGEGDGTESVLRVAGPSVLFAIGQNISR